MEPKRIITDFVPEFQMGRFHDPKKTHSLFVFKSLLTTKCVPSYILHVCLSVTGFVHSFGLHFIAYYTLGTVLAIEDKSVYKTE